MTWIHDNEDSKFVQHAMPTLAGAWKKVLDKSDAELKIDAEFTRPGVVAWLTLFKKKLSVADFKFKLE